MLRVSGMGQSNMNSVALLHGDKCALVVAVNHALYQIHQVVLIWQIWF